MNPHDPRSHVAESIQYAIHELSEALMLLDRIPVHDKAVVGWVAHVMNNYLSVNEATLDLIEKTVAAHPDRDVATWIEGLRHLGHLMHHAVGGLLRVSTPAEFPLKPQHVNLPLLMTRACDYYRPAAAKNQLRIICRFSGDVPLVWADRVVVAVVADNLLSNAVKVSNPDGEILVEIVPGPGGVVCSVRDHGSGLTPLEQAMLFQGGVGGETVSTAGQPTTRIGLVIAKEFIDRMGGRLWFESQVGEGTCFSFRLPYHTAGTSEPPVRGATS